MLFACGSGKLQNADSQLQNYRLHPLNSPVSKSLRGLSAANPQVAWAAGSDNTWLRTADGGSSWQSGTVPTATESPLDFRSVFAFSANDALLISAGQPARFYKTTDGGQSWELAFEDGNEGAFYDAVSFWSNGRGIAFSDPVGGVFRLAYSTNRGNSWQLLENTPAAQNGEAGFAGGNANVFTLGGGDIWFATGGSTSRVFRSNDSGQSWQGAATPLANTDAAAGIFGIAFINQHQGAVVGGKYDAPEQRQQTGAYSTDGGRNWQLSDTSPRGYRSGLAANNKGIMVATGPSGTDYSADGGKNWLALSDSGYHAVKAAGEVFYLSGSKGRLAIIKAEK